MPKFPKLVHKKILLFNSLFYDQNPNISDGWLVGFGGSCFLVHWFLPHSSFLSIVEMGNPV